MIFCVTSRNWMSGEPPSLEDTRIFTGCVGQGDCACATAPSDAVAVTSRASSPYLVFMVFSPHPELAMPDLRIIKKLKTGK